MRFSTAKATTLLWLTTGVWLASWFGAGASAADSDRRILYHEPLSELRVGPLSRAPDERGLGPGVPMTGLSFDAFGRRLELELESNDPLMSGLVGAQRARMGADLHLHRGSVVGVEDSWLRLAQSGDRWSGMIWDGVELLVVDPVDAVAESLVEAPAPDATMNLIYRLSDTESLTTTTCGLDTESSGAGQLGALRRVLFSVRGGPSPDSHQGDRSFPLT